MKEGVKLNSDEIPKKICKSNHKFKEYGFNN